MRTDAHVNQGGLGWRKAGRGVLCAVIVLSATAASRAQEINTDAVDEAADFPRQAAPTAAERDSGGTLGSTSSTSSTAAPGFTLPVRLPDLSSRENFSAALQIVVLLTVLSLAPAHRRS